MKSIILGILSSLFFASTFVLNRQMDLFGGDWVFSASLRYIFTLPILLILLYGRNNIKKVISEIKNNFKEWFIWSNVGFVLFYAPLTFAGDYGPSWLIAGTWQITIIAGILVTPLFYSMVENNGNLEKVKNKIPKKSLFISAIILFGIILMQYSRITSVSIESIIFGFLPVIVAAFSYPLGNRKTMEISGGKLTTFQRILGMTLCSMPAWILLLIYGLLRSGIPNNNQIIQSFIVALFSGIIATWLFFKATDLVRKDMKKLAAVESTQSGEIVFSVLGEIILLGGAFPDISAIFGLLVVISGMIIHSIHSVRINS
ncbi:multidrug resistance efflux transporter family protein [Methanococcus maripaludis]|uniref:Drug/metabolite transporter (DMT)-like permease n=2 Tax=Methanococcus maripaludis TaxID=39152 RepID=A0A7J9PHJ6_METMI|nr:multidrug resistance efflux transporter family protein [Methanococcus maripaludis]MBA2862150.1 drug/metabolite transporter (DMT)-like permease [Methanococcus maripaludis]